MLPSHGQISCTACFPTAQSEQIIGSWKLDNNPGAWGSSSPTILVLGFGKGANQNNIWKKGKFEDVAFAGIRERLKRVLVTVGLLDETTEINGLFSADEERYAFGSLLRCGAGFDQKGDGKFATSGSIIARSFKEEPACTWITTCAQKHLVDLPTSTQVIVMLGVANNYLDNCWQLISGLYEDAILINDVAYKAGGKLFVHLAHPSGANGTFGEWCDMSIYMGQGKKRSLAIQAINNN